MRFAACLEYDGRGFCGFQSQPSACGVQDALEAAIGEIAGERVRVIAAGRTDAGVHAAAQIVHFDAGAARPISAWTRGVNALLPPGASVLFAQPVADEFHARFCATARHYSYLLQNRPQRPGLLAGRAGWYHRPLDVAAMERAAQALVGEHDFSAFRAAECQARSPVKRLHRAAVRASASLIVFEFTANAFLHHMVRNVVGALVQVGSGAQPPEWIGELLAGRDRTRAAATFSPDGLYLTGADYDARFGLACTRRPAPFA